MFLLKHATNSGYYGNEHSLTFTALYSNFEGKESTVANLFNEIIYKLMKLIRFDHMVFCTGVCV